MFEQCSNQKCTADGHYEYPKNSGDTWCLHHFEELKAKMGMS